MTDMFEGKHISYDLRHISYDLTQPIFQNKLIH